MLHSLKARPRLKTKAPSCESCRHFVDTSNGTGCTMFRNAVTGETGDVAWCRSLTGACGPDGAFWAPSAVEHCVDNPCTDCRFNWLANTDRRCERFVDEDGADGVCTELRAPGGQCGPEGAGFEPKPNPLADFYRRGV